VRKLIAAVSAALLLAACGGDDDPTGPGDVAGSSFSANVAGDITRTFSGKAAFGVDADDEFTGFGLVLGITSNGVGEANNVYFYREQAATPGVGQHTIGDAATDAEVPAQQFGATMVLDAGTATAQLCLSTSGTLTVQSSSAQHLKGTFSIQAECLQNSDPLADPQSVTITGSFDAIGLSAT
jgi:hypothetical protein